MQNDVLKTSGATDQSKAIVVVVVVKIFYSDSVIIFHRKGELCSISIVRLCSLILANFDMMSNPDICCICCIVC